MSVLIYDSRESPQLEEAQLLVPNSTTAIVPTPDHLKEKIHGFDYVLRLTNMSLLHDFSEYLIDDDIIGFYYSDFYAGKYPVFHGSFPSAIKMYPFVVFPVAKLVEAMDAQKNPIDYLGSKYVARHIPRLLCRLNNV